MRLRSVFPLHSPGLHRRVRHPDLPNHRRSWRKEGTRRRRKRHRKPAEPRRRRPHPQNQRRRSNKQPQNVRHPLRREHPSMNRMEKSDPEVPQGKSYRKEDTRSRGGTTRNRSAELQPVSNRPKRSRQESEATGMVQEMGEGRNPPLFFRLSPAHPRERNHLTHGNGREYALYCNRTRSLCRALKIEWKE